MSEEEARVQLTRQFADDTWSIVLALDVGEVPEGVAVTGVSIYLPMVGPVKLPVESAISVMKRAIQIMETTGTLGVCN